VVKHCIKPLPLSADIQEAAVLAVGLRSDDARQWHLKWRNKVRTSKYRGLVCTLSFTQYLLLALKAGLRKPSDIGDKPGSYVLGRFGDTGGYTFANCSFILYEENCSEVHSNGRLDYEAVSLCRKGKTRHDTEFIARQSATMTGRRKETHAGLAIISDKNSKNFRLVSPKGKVYTGRNLKGFGLKHKLNQTGLSRLCRGVHESYKGWTGEYIDD